MMVLQYRFNKLLKHVFNHAFKSLPLEPFERVSSNKDTVKITIGFDNRDWCGLKVICEFREVKFSYFYY